VRRGEERWDGLNVMLVIDSNRQHVCSCLFIEKFYCHRFTISARITDSAGMLRDTADCHVGEGGVAQDGEGTIPGQASQLAATKTTNTHPAGDEIRDKIGER
jgi:hypothetical protein